MKKEKVKTNSLKEEMQKFKESFANYKKKNPKSSTFEIINKIR